MHEIFSEVLTSMKSNRMRIALTGFSIGWGIFILVVLLGSSGGLQRGLYKTFFLDVNQVVKVSAGKTAQPWQGMDKGRQLQLHLSDAKALEQSAIQHIVKVCPMARVSLEVNHAGNSVTIPVTGCYDNYLGSDYRKLTKGRDFNVNDIEQNTKVCIVNERLAKQLFSGDNPIGREVEIGGIMFTVVGVCGTMFRQDMTLAIYTPLSTMLTIFRPEGTLDGINLIVKDLKTAEQNEQLTQEVHDMLALHLGCSPTDNKGVAISNPYEQVLSAEGVLAAIGIFVWIIGIATLTAGIVGVSNIMLITVKERTRELGVRKAMGASNESIIALVLLESVIITVIFGYIGMMVGVGLTQLLDVALGSAIPMFQNPTVQFWPIIICNIIMVLAGLVAGYIPAKRAVRIKLVEALTS